MYRLFLCLGLLGLCAWAAPTAEDHEHLHKIDTEHGSIDGIREHSHDGKNVVAYYGIPYAQAPVGDLRFKPPHELEGKSDEVFHADHRPAACLQNLPREMDKFLRIYNATIRRPHSEDCLKLNVWLPDPVPEHATTMVYFHGGGWHFGALDLTNGAELAAQGDVIVVTVASRLGALGFLALGDAPGNMGLMDQQMSLNWIHKNIAAFGGDPAKVTIMGLGSGAASVAYHILAPGSKDFFNRAVLMSGTILHRMAHQDKDKVHRTSKELAGKMGYHGDNDEQHVLEFLRSQDAQDIMDANEYHETNQNILGPIYDGTFIENFDPIRHEHPGLDLMVGTAADEGGLTLLILAPALMKRYTDGSVTRNEFISIMKEMDHDIIDHRVARAIRETYVCAKHPFNPSAIRNGLSQAIGDYFFNCPAERLTDIFVENNPNNNVYRYIFDAKPKNIPTKLVPKWVGSFYGLDKSTVFGKPLQSPNCTEEYKKFTLEVMHHFSNFAKNGDPNLERDADQGGVHWPKYDVKDRGVMILSPDHDKIENHPGSDKCGIMRHLVPVVSHAHECLYDEKLKWHEDNKLHH